jgi:hypothetical protein
LSQEAVAAEMVEVLVVELVDSDQHLVQLLVQEILAVAERLREQ